MENKTFLTSQPRFIQRRGQVLDGSDFAEVYDRLKQYEREEKDAHLLRLPFKVGDIVYAIVKCSEIIMWYDNDYFNGTGAVECPYENQCNFEDCDDAYRQVFETNISCLHLEDKSLKNMEFSLENIMFPRNISSFGKTVFISRNEAEKALEAADET